MQLSILVPSVASRRNTFLPKMLDQLYQQQEQLPPDLQNQVEILCLIDNKTMFLGDKRNRLIDIAQGEYVAMVDDDDEIAPDYIAQLLSATEQDADIITFTVEVSLNGKAPKPCYYSKDYAKDHNKPDAYYRLPNHIMCVKKAISQLVSFPSIKNGEDSAYSALLKQHLKTEYNIPKVLYYYNYNEDTTVAQEDLPYIQRKRRQNMPIAADIVILSNAKTPELQALTQQAVDTAISAANGLRINVIVIEQTPRKTYGPDVTMIYRIGPFNYNKFANDGIRRAKSDNIIIANNDIVCKNGYLHKLLAANYPIVSAKCPLDGRQKDVTENEAGYICGRNLSGWFFMIKRQLWERIGGFDERVSYWTSDNVVIEQLKAIDVPPMLVHDAFVEHLQSRTLQTLPLEERDRLTRDQVKLYNKLYDKNLFNWGKAN